MESVDDEFRWKNLWLFLSSDWAAEFAGDLWLPAASMPQIQAVTRKIVEPWVDAGHLVPFTVAHYQLCSTLKAIGGDKLVHYIYSWRSLCFEGSLSGFKWIPLWRQENERYIVEVPDRAVDRFNAFRAAIIEADKRYTSRIDASRKGGRPPGTMQSPRGTRSVASTNCRI